MTKIIEIEGGEVTASLEDRTITGRLIPFGEEGRTNVGRFTIENPDDIDTSDAEADPSIISHNLDHERSGNVGRATRIWKQPDGVYATYRIANTAAGDAYLADVLDPKGKRKRLSGEFGPAVIRAGKLVPGHAKLWGSAGVERGAFPSAMVLAADTPDEPQNAERADADNDHPAISLPAMPADITVVTEDGDSALYTPEATPAEDNPEGGSTVTATATDVLAGAAPVAPIPATLTAPPATTAPRVDRDPDLRQVLAAMAAVRANPADGDARDVLAALADIKISGNGSLPTAANGTPSAIQPTWVGQLYQGVEYVREFITLGKLGTDISVEGKKGFKLFRRAATTGTGEMELTKESADWAGNKAELSGYSGFTQTAQSTRRNFALGNDIAREWYDLPGGAPFIEGFLKLLIEHYYFWSDAYANADWITAAGAPVAPDTGSYNAAYPDSMGMVIQGILAVKARKGNTKRRDVPTFAIVNELAYTELAYAVGGEQNLPAFVDFRVSTDSEGTADRVQIVQGNTGIEDTASVIVGARPAVEFDELPGEGPLQINALDLAHGGIDRAVHGYLQTFSVRPEAVVLVGVADVP